MFDKEHLGKPISEELSNHLMSNTSQNDIADAASETGISLSTISYVMRRRNNLSEGNSIGIARLCEIALNNAKTKKIDAQKAIEFFESQIVAA